MSLRRLYVSKGASANRVGQTLSWRFLAAAVGTRQSGLDIMLRHERPMQRKEIDVDPSQLLINTTL